MLERAQHWQTASRFRQWHPGKHLALPFARVATRLGQRVYWAAWGCFWPGLPAKRNVTTMIPTPTQMALSARLKLGQT